MAFWTRDPRRGHAEEPADAGQEPHVSGEPLSPLDRPDEHPQTTDPAVFPRALSIERVAEDLRRRDISFAVTDQTGDLTTMWGTRTFVLAAVGSPVGILQVRGQWNREASIEHLDEILTFCNEWNAQRFWPKTYAQVRDDGAVMVRAENAHDLHDGVNDAQLAQLISSALVTTGTFFAGLDSRFPDPLRQEDV